MSSAYNNIFTILFSNWKCRSLNCKIDDVLKLLLSLCVFEVIFRTSEGQVRTACLSRWHLWLSAVTQIRSPEITWLWWQSAADRGAARYLQPGGEQRGSSCRKRSLLPFPPCQSSPFGKKPLHCVVCWSNNSPLALWYKSEVS